jgi:DNA invertase Pin-like site-specific DNA recombinase
LRIRNTQAGAFRFEGTKVNTMISEGGDHRLCAIGHPPYQHDTSNDLRPAIGYIRVSTEKQDKEERGLERQTERLQEASHGFGLKLTHIYEDVGSGRGAHNEQKRPGLLQALREAQELSVPLIATSASRLSRDWASFEKLAVAQDVQVIVVDEGG